jgi:hypothetical protein
VKPTEGVGDTMDFTVGVRVGVGVSLDTMMGPGRVGENIGPQAEAKNIKLTMAKNFLGIICLPHINKINVKQINY